MAVLERGSALGGLAGSFERNGHVYPLGYHHILPKDRVLLAYLELIGARSRVRWRRVDMLFETGSGLLDLSRPAELVRLPLRWSDKLRFIRLMLRAYATSDWSGWQGRSAAELLDAWAGPEVRRQLFEPLCQLKFERPASEVSAAWLGARLSYREGASALGYIPAANWTDVLCSGLARLLDSAGVQVRLGATVDRLEGEAGRIKHAVLSDGSCITGDVFVSAVPTETYLRMSPRDATPELTSIRYTALLSLVCGAPVQPIPRFYWLNLAQRQTTACAIFRLDALNPTIGERGEMCLNFVTHLADRTRPSFSMPTDALVGAYLDDYRRVFGRALMPAWVHLSRLPMYSPVFDREYRNPPVRSATWQNVYFAGNYRTFPSVASTGTALESGSCAADTIVAAASAQTAGARRSAAA